MARGEIDAVYHGGDISYAVGFEVVWDFFFNMLAPAAAGTLYLSTVGNHESDWPDTSTYYTGTDSGGECGVALLKYLPQPSPPDRARPWVKPWWSYDVGLIHFVGMSTEHDFRIGSEQYKFLLADLQSLDRTKTPFVIFGGHRAMYLNSDYGGSVSSDIEVSDLLIANVEPMLQRYKVNLCFWGHNHVVQRQSAVYQKKIVQASTARQIDGNTVHVYSSPQAPVHMVVGTGGAKLSYNAITDPALRPAWNEMILHEWGYAVVVAHNASVLEWTWVDCMDDKVKDRVLITQDASQAAWPCPFNSTCMPDTAPDAAAAGAAGLSAAQTGAVVGGVLAAALLVAAVAYYCWLGPRAGRGKQPLALSGDLGDAEADYKHARGGAANLLGAQAQAHAQAHAPLAVAVPVAGGPGDLRGSIPSPEPVRTTSAFEVSAGLAALRLSRASADRERGGSWAGAGAGTGLSQGVETPHGTG